ncbi:MAG: hypothetical protein J1F03_06955 [Oscillospiraceae bacterium]|nr:hypothetical protein [Oscillospiraceae bacterium]
MKKRLAAAAVLISVIFTLSGCFPTGEKETTPTNSVDFTEIETYEYSKDYLEVSFKLPEIPKDVPIRIKIKEKNFDADEIIELFFGGKTILEDQTWNGNYTADDKSYLFADPNRNIVRFADGKTSPTPVNNSIDFPVNYQMPIYHLEDYFREKYFPGGDGELEAFPRSDATGRALGLTSILGITNLGEPDIFAVTLDSYEKFREYYDGDGFFNDSLTMTKENEIYYLVFPKVYAGIELADVSLSVQNHTNGRSSQIFLPKLTVGVSKDDIFFLDSGAVYEEEYEVLSNEPIKYDFNYALNELESYLSNVYFSSKKTAKINTAKLVYYPIEVNEEGTIECVLTWSFEGYVGKMDDDFYWEDYKIIIRTDNGSKIVVD